MTFLNQSPIIYTSLICQPNKNSKNAFFDNANNYIKNNKIQKKLMKIKEKIDKIHRKNVGGGFYFVLFQIIGPVYAEK